jgi:hypothetical protein
MVYEQYGLSEDEYWSLVASKPNLIGAVHGACGEAHLKMVVESTPGVEFISTPDDHDRRDPGDIKVRYKSRLISIDSKLLQTNTVRVSGSTREGKVQIDGSDCSTRRLPNGETVKSTCIPVDKFDIVAVNCFHFDQKPSWQFAPLHRLARAKEHPLLIKSTHNVCVPAPADRDAYPFSEDLLEALEYVISLPDQAKYAISCRNIFDE